MLDEGEVDLFCPRCGVELTRNVASGELECVPGAMQLSKHMEHRLSDRYEQHVGGFDVQSLPVTIGGTWFCPACGERADERTPGDLRCPTCRRSMSDLAPELIEFHYHRR
jgi:rubrerythrin